MALQPLPYRLKTKWMLRKNEYGNVKYDQSLRWTCQRFKLAVPEEMQAGYAPDGVYFQIIDTRISPVNIVLGYEYQRDNIFDYYTITDYDGPVDTSQGYYTTIGLFDSELIAANLEGTSRKLVLDNVGSSRDVYFFVEHTLGVPYRIVGVSADTTITDGAVTLTFDVPDITAFAMQIFDENGVLAYEHWQDDKNVTQTHMLPARVLATGKYRIRIQAATYLTNMRFGEFLLGEFQDYDGYRPGVVSEWAEFEMEFARLCSKILAFEPNGVPQNREKDIRVTWASERQHGYVLEVRQNGALVKSFAGTVGTMETIAANTLQSGNTELVLTLKYIPEWGTEEDAMYTSKTITFDAYGTPPLPVFTSGAAFATAYPVFTWTSSEQYTYRLKVLLGQALVYDSGEVQSYDKQHRMPLPLDIGTYTVTLQVHNEYGLFSEIASQIVSIAFERPEPPRLFLAADRDAGTVHLNIINEQGGVPVVSCDLLRRKYGEDNWMRIAASLAPNSTYVDYAVASGTTYEYMARAVGAQGEYANGIPAPVEALVRFTRICDAHNPENEAVLQLEPKKDERFRKGVYLMQYSGLSAPKVEYGGERYCSVDIAFLLPQETADKLRYLHYAAELLLLRDNRGRKLFGVIEDEPTFQDSTPGYVAASFTFTECYHTEEV